MEDDDEESPTKKPNELEPFINPSSDLTEPLQSMALQCIREKKLFVDKRPAIAKLAHHYEFAGSIFGKEYLLFRPAQNKSNVSNVKSKVGELQLDAKDAVQGAISSQYLLSSIASLANRYPEVLYRLFPLLRNPSSIYGIKLFIDGRWKTVITDSFFPVDQKNKLVYASSGNE